MAAPCQQDYLYFLLSPSNSIFRRLSNYRHVGAGSSRRRAPARTAPTNRARGPCRSHRTGRAPARVRACRGSARGRSRTPSPRRAPHRDASWRRPRDVTPTGLRGWPGRLRVVVRAGARRAARSPRPRPAEPWPPGSRRSGPDLRDTEAAAGYPAVAAFVRFPPAPRAFERLPLLDERCSASEEVRASARAPRLRSSCLIHVAWSSLCRLWKPSVWARNRLSHSSRTSQRRRAGPRPTRRQQSL